MRRTFSDKLTAVTETFLFSYSFSRMEAYYTQKKIVYYLMENSFVLLGHITGPLSEIKIIWITNIIPMLRDLIFAH